MNNVCKEKRLTRFSLFFYGLLSATESFSSVEHNENTSLQILYKYAQKNFFVEIV